MRWWPTTIAAVGNSSYRRGSLEGAKSDVERYRSTLEAEGRSRFSQNYPTQSWQPSSEASIPKPAVTHKDVKRQSKRIRYGSNGSKATRKGNCNYKSVMSDDDY